VALRVQPSARKKFGRLSSGDFAFSYTGLAADGAAVDDFRSLDQVFGDCKDSPGDGNAQARTVVKAAVGVLEITQQYQ
jgi:hypothetical protein